MSERIASDEVRSARQKFRYRFFNYPRDVSWDAYDRARETFIERIAGVDNIRSVYESGRPSTRGISDIDLIVVVADDVDDIRALRDGIEGAKTDEYYFFHGPEVVTAEVFRTYHSVLPQPKELHHLYGDRLEWEDRRGEFTALAYLVDSLTETYPREFLEFLFLPSLTDSHELRIVSQDLLCLLVPQVISRRVENRLDVRLAIHRLNSFRNDIRMFLDTYRRESEVLDRFDRSITELRQAWFENPDQETTLLARLEDAITASFAFVDEIARYLGSQNIVVGRTGDERRSVGKFTDIYVDDWTQPDGEAVSCRNFANRGIPACHLPQPISVNQRIRATDPTVEVPVAYRDAVELRDEVSAKREASMEAYKYHPLRKPYRRLVSALTGTKVKLWAT